MGVASWDRALPPIPDGASGWTPYQFDVEFSKAALQRPAYQHTSQSAAISVLVQAMERVRGAVTIDDHEFTEKVREKLASNSFATVYGNISFDENGQSAAPSLLLQYDANGTLHVLLPNDLAFTGFDMEYPMPSWQARDCTFLSQCLAMNGTCTPDGLCQCRSPANSKGQGTAAVCILPEDKTNGLSIPLPVIAVPIVVVLLVVAGMYLCRANLKKHNDSVWQIEKKDLVFAETPEVLGYGSFGMVLLAEYRGTQVAVKRVLSPSRQNKSFHSSGMVSNANSFDTSGRSSASGYSASSDDNSNKPMTNGGDGDATNYALRKLDKCNTVAKRKKRKKEFITEMRQMSKLRHPCIVTFMGMFYALFAWIRRMPT